MCLVLCADSEVDALRNVPNVTPQYSNTLASGTSNAYQFSNSLYGALSVETQNTHRIVSPQPTSQSPVHQSPKPVKSPDSLMAPSEPNYCVISREYMDENSPSAGYSEISREYLEEDNYSYINRENLEGDGYYVVTRENLEEAEESEGELLEPEKSLETSKLLDS